MYKFLRFPEWKYKAVTLSYDDGTVYDRKLIDILDKYGLKCTFNLNSGITAAVVNLSACFAAALSPVLISLVLDLSDGNWETGFIALFVVALSMTVVALMFLLFNVRSTKRLRRKNDTNVQ